MSDAPAKMENRCASRRQLRLVACIVTLLAMLTACSATHSSASAREDLTSSASSATSSTSTTASDGSADEVGPPLVTGTFETLRVPDPDCSPRADGEGFASAERDISLEAGLRNAIREYPLPQEGLLHAYQLETATRRVYVAAEAGDVTAVVTMTLHSNDDGTLQAWIADRSITCL